MALLTELDVVNMRFKEPQSVENGYDQDEVDDFLDLVAETIAQLTKDKADLEAQVQAAHARVSELEHAAGEATPASAPSPADSTAVFTTPVSDEASNATGVLALAQKLHDEYVSNGKAESQRMITEAETEAQRIMNETNAERARIERETEDHKNAVLTALDEERTSLERKISDLRDFERDYRGRLKSYLESLLTNVNNMEQQG